MINIKNIIVSSSSHVTNLTNKRKENEMDSLNPFNIHISNENVIMTDKNAKQTAKWEAEIVRLKKKWIIVLLKFRFEQLKKEVKTGFVIPIFSFKSVENNFSAENTKIQTLCKKKNVLKFLLFLNTKIKRKLNTKNLSDFVSKFLTWKEQSITTNFDKFNVQLLIWTAILTLSGFDLKKPTSQSFDKNFRNDC